MRNYSLCQHIAGGVITVGAPTVSGFGFQATKLRGPVVRRILTVLLRASLLKVLSTARRFPQSPYESPCDGLNPMRNVPYVGQPYISIRTKLGAGYISMKLALLGPSIPVLIIRPSRERRRSCRDHARPLHSMSLPWGAAKIPKAVRRLQKTGQNQWATMRTEHSR